MNEKHRATLDAIKLVAGLEAQRIALAAINQAVQGRLLPAENYNVSINVDIEPRVIALATGGGQ